MEFMNAAEMLSELCLSDPAFQAFEYVLKGHRFIGDLTDLTHHALHFSAFSRPLSRRISLSS